MKKQLNRKKILFLFSEKGKKKGKKNKKETRRQRSVLDNHRASRALPSFSLSLKNPKFISGDRSNPLIMANSNLPRRIIKVRSFSSPPI